MESEGPRGSLVMLHLLQIWHWMGVAFVTGGRFLMMPRLDMLTIVSMETWPRRMCMSRRISWLDMAVCCRMERALMVG